MEHGSYFQFIAPITYVALSTGFLAFILYDRKSVVPKLLALSYAIGAAAMLLHITANYFQPVFITYVVLAMYLGTTTLLTSAFYVRARRAVPFKAFLAIGVVLLLGTTWFFWVTPSIMGRGVIAYVTNGAVLALALIPLWQTRHAIINRVAFGLMAIFSGQFLVRAVIATFVYSENLTPENYLSSWTVASVHFVNSIGALAIATTFLVALGTDVITELRRRSDTDPLSGLLNRRGFSSAATEVLSKLQGDMATAQLVIADLDDFKRVNDELGHAVGDEVIRTFGQLLARGTRKVDVVGRLGGEEFAILLTDCSVTDAGAIVEDIRKAFAETPIRGIPFHRHMSASFGLAEWRADITWESLYDRADRALYQAKQEGKNRLVIRGRKRELANKVIPYHENQRAALAG